MNENTYDDALLLAQNEILSQPHAQQNARQRHSQNFQHIH